MSDINSNVDTLIARENEITSASGKVANFSYTDKAYQENDYAGVERYDFAHEQNVPSKNPSTIVTDEVVLNKGLRSQASSISRMFLNHFFGRVSYNLNKIHDFFKTFLDGYKRHLAQDCSLYMETQTYMENDVCFIVDIVNDVPSARFFRCIESSIKGQAPVVDGELNSAYWTEINAVGKANGVASLDENGRIPFSQLPESSIEFKGEWNASTNDPELVDGVGTNGDFYIVTVGGTREFGGVTYNFRPNDRVMYEGSTQSWLQLKGGEVLSVNNVQPDGEGNVDLPTTSIARGGTGATTSVEAMRNLLADRKDDSAITDDDYILKGYEDGAANTTAKTKASNLYSYISDKLTGGRPLGSFFLSKYIKHDYKFEEHYWNDFTKIAGILAPDGLYIWTDGKDIYFSNNSTQLVLDKETSTWRKKVWKGNNISFLGNGIWKDGDIIYFSNRTSHYVLDVETSTWTEKTWNGLDNFYGSDIWTDGDNIYHSSGSSQYVLNKETSTWSVKEWNGLDNFDRTYIWTDNTNVYYSYSSLAQYVLNKETSTWSVKEWNGYLPTGNDIWTDGEKFYNTRAWSYVLDIETSTWAPIEFGGEGKNLSGTRIWTDGENIYYSESDKQYVFDKEDLSWNAKSWTGTVFLYTEAIWTDGKDIYHSKGSNQYILDKENNSWSIKNWQGLTSFDGKYVWTDGDDIYYSNRSTHYVLDRETSTWSVKAWNGLSSSDRIYGNGIWTDGENIYSSYTTVLGESFEYVLNKSTATWSKKTWNNKPVFLQGGSIWTDGNNIYYSYTDEQYVLNSKTSTWSVKTWNGLEEISGTEIWTDGYNIYYSNGYSDVSLQYILDKKTSTWVPQTWEDWEQLLDKQQFFGDSFWSDGSTIHYITDKGQYTVANCKVNIKAFDLPAPLISPGRVHLLSTMHCW